MTLMDEVGECIVYWIGKWWQRRKDVLWRANGGRILSQHIHYYYYHIFLTDLFN